MTRPARGFTLIELIVVVAIVSIMLAIAVPSFASFISNYRVTSAANEILQGITMARGEALKRGRRVTMAPINNDWRQGWYVFIDTGASPNHVYDSGEELIYQHGVLPDSSIYLATGADALPFKVNYVAFEGTGYPSAVTGSSTTGGLGGIVLKDQLASTVSSTNNTRTVCLALLGRPRVFKGVDTCANA